MAQLYSIGPLRVAKRQWKAPWAIYPVNNRHSHDYYDSEKRALAQNDSDYDSEYESDSLSSDPSSRATSNSFDPMLGKHKSPRRTASAYVDPTPRRRFNRIFSITLGSLLVGLIIVLISLSVASKYHAARMAKGYNDLSLKESSRVWESFPFLKRYHGGIRTLVSRGENKPEYPEESDEILPTLEHIELVPDNVKGLLRRDEDDEKKNNNAKGMVRRDEDGEKDNIGSKHYQIPASHPFDPFIVDSTPRKAIKECFLDMESKIRVPKLQVYPGVVKGMPDNVLGSYDLFGLNGDVCFDRFGRLGPYGLGYSQKFGGTGAGMEGDTEGSQLVWAKDPEVDYRTINWANAQERCADSNRHRFRQDVGKARSILSADSKRKRQIEEDLDPEEEEDEEVDQSSTRERLYPVEKGSSNPASSSQSIHRQAVVIRTWSDYQYDPEDIMYLRALISELSLTSGTEYFVHFLIHVKDNNLQIWSDDLTYEKILNASLPEEFRGMGTLWSEKQMAMIYAGLDESNYRDHSVYGVYRSTYLPMSYFAHQHPEYDFFWHWEMDVRYTGHFYHLFDRVGSWAKQQPRKGLWERNSRFYVPREYGSWEDFRQMVRVQTEHGTSSPSNLFSKLGSPAADLSSDQKTVEKPIWGPEPPEWDDVLFEDDPKPPTSYDKDKYEWGVGGEADLITFNPLFDPDQTGWNLAGDVTGYNTTGGQLPPRRVAIVTASRLSRRLLDTMHHEAAFKRHTMFSEMWPASCALHHGLKAVYAPHPEYIDRRWPTDYLAAVFNGGRNGAAGGSRNSVFNDAHHHNFLGLTWYYHSGFPNNLWKRWLGYKVDNDGGEEWEVANEGRMCLPAMLLHPVKQADLIFEHRDD